MMKFILGLLIWLVGNAAIAQKATLYLNLEKGRYEVGYRTMIKLDYSRTYNLNFPNDTSSRTFDPRPVIINIWYPAKITNGDKAMTYGDYIKIDNKDASLRTFVKRIEEYNRKNSSFYIFYEDSLNAEQSKQFDDHLRRSIRVYPNAAPVKETFPLVIYHAGLGGTLNDNTVLCEYLASHGFVVMTGAFQSSDYRDMEINWDLERSTKDIDFMLNSVKDLPFIDFSRIAAIGHSYGAQAVLAYRTEDHSRVSSLIIIDTTMDYTVDASPDNFSKLVTKLYGKINNLSVPMLVFANPEATFRVMDSLQHANRVYCTVDLDHNDFTSLTSLPIQYGLVKRSDSESVWQKYTTVVDYCLNFLNFHLVGHDSRQQFALQKLPGMDVFEIPKGRKLDVKIPEYTDFSIPPSRIQFDKLLLDSKFEILDKVFTLYPRIWSEDYINNTGYGLLKRNVDASIYLFKWNVKIRPDSWNAWDSLGEGYMIKGEKELAIKSYLKSMELNPKNENGKEMLRKLNR